jgi:hypothetical protein
VLNADRLLLRVSTRDGQLFQVWFTRRLLRNLWPHLSGMVTRAQLNAGNPKATVLPEARQMFAQTVREQSLKQADFRTPFDDTPKVQPLGEEPMLAVECRLTLLPDRAVRWTLIDPQRRDLTLQLPERLATAVHELMVKALVQAQWDLPGVDTAAPAATAPGAAEPPRVLN